MGEIPRLGSGYDRFGGGVKSTILKINSQDDKGATAINSNYYICTSSEEVVEKMNISASLEGGGLWGSISAKMDFAKSLCKTSTSITAFLVVTKVVQQSTIREVSFKDAPPDAATMYKQGGDSYVTYVKYGAEYIGAFTYTAESVEAQMEIKAELKTTITAANFQGDLKTAIDNVNTSKKTTFQFTHHAVGLPNNVDLPNEKTLGDFPNKLHKATIDTADVLEIQTRLYDDVRGCPDMDHLKSAYELYTRDMHGKHAYSTIESQARKTKAAIETVRAVYTFYRQAHIETGWDKRLQRVQDILNQLRDWKRDVQRNPTSKPTELNLDESSLELPVPRYSFYTPGYAGQSDRGDPWDDLTRNQVMDCVYPQSIQVRSNGIMDKLTTVYGYKDPKRGTFERSHGGGGGTLGEKVTLNSDDLISQVDIWDKMYDFYGWSWKVNGIRIRIKDSYQEKSFGNCEGNQHPQVSPNDQWCVIGWTGRSNSAVDYLKAVYVGFNIPEWKMPQLPDTR